MFTVFQPPRLRYRQLTYDGPSDALDSPAFAVNSPAFAAAVFDLYIGEQPVSSEARLTALSAAQRMMASGACMYPHFCCSFEDLFQHAPRVPVTICKHLTGRAGFACRMLSLRCWLQGLMGTPQQQDSPACAKV